MELSNEYYGENVVELRCGDYCQLWTLLPLLHFFIFKLYSSAPWYSFSWYPAIYHNPYLLPATSTKIAGMSTVYCGIYDTSVKIIKNEVGCRDDTVPKTVETRRHCEED